MFYEWIPLKSRFYYFSSWIRTMQTALFNNSTIHNEVEKNREVFSCGSVIPAWEIQHSCISWKNETDVLKWPPKNPIYPFLFTYASQANFLRCTFDALWLYEEYIFGFFGVLVFFGNEKKSFINVTQNDSLPIVSK